MIPTIYKGDDTDFRGAARLSLRIGTEADLSGCTVEFTFLGQTRRFSGDAAAKPLSFAFSASETALFPVGVHRARVRVFDPEGRVKTVDDSVRIRVTDSVADAYGTDGEQQIPVSLVSGFTMPDIPESLDAAASDTVGVFKAKFNDLLALLRSVSALAVAVLLPFAASAANVETAPLDDIPGTAAVVTNVTLAGLATTNDVASAIASATNGLLRTESDPMFTAWTNGTATLSGAFVQGSGFKNALVNNPILASGARAHAQGYATMAYGDNSHAEGTSTVASNMNSHAEGESTKALGRGSHAEGYFAVASNDYSHAEGDHTVAGGILSHAGGSYSRAWGDTSRAWGIGATANAAMSVSEGNQTQANGWYSTARGYWTAANGVMSHAEGVNATAEGNPIFSPEDVSDLSDLLATYAWSAVYKGEDTNSNYRSHGPGTYNINPSGGLAGFFVGETNLQTLLGEKASTGDVQAAISAVNPAFSNAVLAVGLNIDTNSVAVLNEIASTFGGFPIEGTATTVGGLLAALAAAIAWLRKNKADKATTLAGYGITDAETKGVAIPKYEFVTAAIADGVLTVAPYTNAQVTSDGTAFMVAVAEGDGKARDCQFTLDCTEIAPTITWGANFHPRTDAETDFACVAGKRNIYWITEYAPNEFAVAGWQVMDGGTSGGAA